MLLRALSSQRASVLLWLLESLRQGEKKAAKDVSHASLARFLSKSLHFRAAVHNIEMKIKKEAAHFESGKKIYTHIYVVPWKPCSSNSLSELSSQTWWEVSDVITPQWQA